MPTYEYQCEKCSNLYEKREGFDAPARQKCPSCGGKAQRVIHAPPIVFKGSGFYKTDSRKAPPEESAATTAASSESGSDNKSSSSDSASSKGSSSEKSSSSESSKGGSSKDAGAAAAS